MFTFIVYYSHRFFTKRGDFPLTGLYIHVPFCVSKCPYCDFYSIDTADDSVKDAYTTEICRRLTVLPDLTADTLYFGGGTPSLLGGKRLANIVTLCKEKFLTSGAEITLEANPADELYDTFAAFAAAGVVNVVLNLIFVIVLEMDVAGVELATVISQCISAILIIICLMREEDAYKFSFRKLLLCKI